MHPKKQEAEAEMNVQLAAGAIHLTSTSSLRICDSAGGGPVDASKEMIFLSSNAMKNCLPLFDHKRSGWGQYWGIIQILRVRRH